MAERERAEGMSGEDAAWRDLVARFDLPGGQDGTAPPWPEREDLPPARHQQPPRGADAGAGIEAAADDEAAAADTAFAGADAGTAPAEAGTAPADAGTAPADAGTAPADAGTAALAGADADAAGAGADPASTVTGGSVSARGEPLAGRPDDGHGRNEQQAAGAGTGGAPEAAIPDRARVIKPAVPFQLSAAGDAEGEDDHYIPPPPPPLPALDPVAKGAWAAFFGGPVYLLVATSAGWVLPGWATFGAVAAFVGGFAVLVIRMGDNPSRGSGPDNGAVL